MVDTRTCVDRIVARIVSEYLEPKGHLMFSFTLPKGALPFGWYSRKHIYISSAWLQDELKLGRFDYGALQRALLAEGYVCKGYAADKRIISAQNNPHLGRRQKVLIFDRAKLTPHIEAAKERRWRDLNPRRYPSWL